MTLYQIKPLFQSLLRPTMFWLYKHHVTANHITLAALAEATHEKRENVSR